MAEVSVEDHVEAGLSRLPSFWDDKNNARGLLTSYLQYFNQIEDTLFELKNNRGIDTAIGVQLDVLGKLFGVDREGKLDPVYRDAIKQRIGSRGASGTTFDIKDIVRVLTEANLVHVYPHYPACTYVFANTVINKSQADIIQESHAAGVRTRVVWFDGPGYMKLEDGDGATETLLTQYLLGLNAAGDSLVVEDGGVESDLLIEEDTISGVTSGFTSLLPGQSEYEVVPDGLGLLSSLAPTTDITIDTGLIIDDLTNYVIDHNGNYIRYIDIT